MNRHINAIAARLSLRPPQRRSLEILDRITEIAPPRKNIDLQATLTAMQLDDPIVLAKKEAAMKWCANATNHAAAYGGKSWCYLLIPHDTIADKYDACRAGETVFHQPL